VRNIIEYLENTTHGCNADKVAITDGIQEITFRELYNATQAIASALLDKVSPRQPVLVCMDKRIEFVEAILAVASIGGIYIPIDIELPYQRVEHIINTVSANIVLSTKKDTLPEQLEQRCSILYIEDLVDKKIAIQLLNERRNKLLSTDPLYAIFTSGSTGVPKGIITTHQALISFIDEMTERFEFSEKDVLANQVPFYFDASTKDIYLMCKCACTMHIIPKMLFMLPKKLMEFLNEKQVTRVIWAPSLLCMIAKFAAFDKEKPKFLRSVFFVGEQMPAKQYNIWKKSLPDVQYINLYGSTEVSGSSTYYPIERDIDDSELIPIGYSFAHVDVFLLDADDKLVDEKNVNGEICVRGLSVSCGYFGDFEKTKSVFVQNPLNPYFPEIIYRSGDVGRYNDYGELVYVCRRDFQIKRMGRRIELGEIEAAIGAIKDIDRVCCLFNEENQDLIAIYSGNVEIAVLKKALSDILPVYMMPNVYHNLEEFPLNANRKIDRVKLKNMFVKDV